MDVKKYPDKDLNKQWGIFFNIGLIITLLFTIILFQWNFSDGEVGDLTANDIAEDDMEEQIITEIQLPPPPKIKAQTIEVVDDEEEIEEEPPPMEEPDEETVIEEIPPEEPEEEVVEQIFNIVEDPASPIGGMSAFRKHVGKYLQANYPQRARATQTDGTVYIKFVVEKDGTATGFKVLKGIGSGCDEAAIEAIKTYGKWKPGKQRGRAVRQYFNFPVKFSLG